ncbi:hypothetical protein HELRODRAFT_160586 [Helobdella robusta]|uniref:Uncharacterized protein n=1 Tax=Helobdella robusta TaxID=6412 RepID=T1EQG4_HELRO|nr:hypothetical protein HELRODRAFT_160586 [Helobdella robusta]ESO06415.1 hypothetical protein HELRODRAFT_160586 [Helobdella robusta]
MQSVTIFNFLWNRLPYSWAGVFQTHAEYFNSGWKVANVEHAVMFINNCISDGLNSIFIKKPRTGSNIGNDHDDRLEHELKTKKEHTGSITVGSRVTGIGEHGAELPDGKWLR